MIIEAFLISLLLGFIRKGSLRNLGKIPLRHYYVFVLPILIVGITSTIAVRNETGNWISYVRAANIVQYIGLLIAVGLNVHMPEIRLAGIGIFLNGLVITANGGMMPCSENALKIAGVAKILKHTMAHHSLITSQTRMEFLSDIIPIPPLPFIPERFSATAGQVCSIGDLVVAVALFLLIQRYMCLPSEIDTVKQPA
jgi:hypothetical protein